MTSRSAAGSSRASTFARKASRRCSLRRSATPFHSSPWRDVGARRRRPLPCEGRGSSANTRSSDGPPGPARRIAASRPSIQTRMSGRLVADGLEGVVTSRQERRAPPAPPRCRRTPARRRPPRLGDPLEPPPDGYRR